MRSEFLALDDDALLKKCRIDNFRSTGPGGQHRNKTDSAVRLTLNDHQISASADESRSQHQNRLQALKRLRREIAYHLREEEILTWDDDVKMNIDNPKYPSFLGIVVDALIVTEYKLGEAAQHIGITTGKLNKALQRDKQLWDFVNQERQKLGLKTLRMK